MGLASTALLFVPALIHFDNYTLDRFYRWWVVHLWVEGVWELILGGMLAFLLIRLSGADREVMEKWLYVIVGLTFLSGILGTGHHYYWIGVPPYWLWIGGYSSRARAAGLPRHGGLRLRHLSTLGLGHPNTLALHWTIGSAIFSTLGAGILGLAHTWPQVNAGHMARHITTMHGHMAFFGAYAMITLGMITYALPELTGMPAEERQTTLGIASFWLMVGGMFGMTMALAAAGIAQTYLERIMGFGYLETQQKIQVHYLMARHRRGLRPRGGRLLVGLRRGRPAPWNRQRKAMRAPRARSRGVDRARNRPRPSRRRFVGPEPYYRPRKDEIAVFSPARGSATRHAQGANRLRQNPLRPPHGVAARSPAVTVACHDDLSANDLTGRFLVRGGETVWQDGPLTMAARAAHSATSTRSSRRGRTRSSRSIRSPTTGACFPSRRPQSSSRRIPTSSSWCPTTPAIRTS